MIANLIQDYIADFASNPLDLRQLAVAEGVLPLFIDMGGVFVINTKGDIISFPFGLNADGDMVAYPLDNSDGLPRVETDPRVHNIVLFQGSKKYPELEDLVPAKPADARVCPHCMGTGISPYAAKLNTDALVCYCGGLGWLP